MKIAYLTQSYPPMISGAALAVQRLAHEMAHRGHQVLVLAASDREMPYTAQNGELEVVRLKSIHNPARAGQRFMVWPQQLIRRHLEGFEPDLLHLQEPLNLGLCGLREGARLNLPVMLTLHQLPWFVSSYLSNSLRCREVVENFLWEYGRWFAGRCAVSIAPSYVVARIFKERTGLTPAVIGYGVETRRFHPRPARGHESRELRSKYGLDSKLPVILHVGRLDKDKQVHLVLQAAARVFRVVEAQLLVVGDGSKRDELLMMSAQMGILARVFYTGFVDRRGDLPGIYRLAAAFITASEIETQGLVVLEALASGVPVVAPRAGALPEIVADGVNGFLVSPKAVDAMARRLRWLLSHLEEARSLGAAGVETAKQHAVEPGLEAHESLYLQYVPGRERQPALQLSRPQKPAKIVKRTDHQVPYIETLPPKHR